MQAVLCFFLVALPVTATAQWDNPTLTPFVGYRDGGQFEDAAMGRHLDVDESEIFGLMLGWDVAPGQFELSLTHQSSELDADGSVPPGVEVDVDITNLMAAAKIIFHPDSGAYLGFMLGITEIDVDSSKLDNNFYPAIGLDGGFDYRIDEQFGIRVGLRSIASVLGTDSTDLCDTSKDCPIRIDDSKLVQWDFYTGLSIRF